MHPDLEIDCLVSVTANCESLARTGRFEEAWRRLSMGRARIERYERQGDPSAPRLLALWECALTRFHRRHRAALTSRTS